MDRLCGRPGCSERASVAYGMRAEDLVFWLDRLPERADDIGGALCRRHADSMVVPRGWTLDDLRDPDLHLFRPPAPLPPPPREPRRRSARAERSEQLELVDGEPSPPITTLVERGSDGAGAGADAAIDVAAEVDADVDADGAAAGPWTPDFDEADDLDGLLAARGPLLSRAFRTADRADG